MATAARFCNCLVAQPERNTDLLASLGGPSASSLALALGEPGASDANFDAVLDVVADSGDLACPSSSTIAAEATKSILYLDFRRLMRWLSFLSEGGSTAFSFCSSTFSVGATTEGMCLSSCSSMIAWALKVCCVTRSRVLSNRREIPEPQAQARSLVTSFVPDRPPSLHLLDMLWRSLTGVAGTLSRLAFLPWLLSPWLFKRRPWLSRKCSSTVWR
mmetsp:Transcript_1463/g.2546  ORF Transcript_1463/g.2546 Transcript_1463/m.2546 type:complete len:216 (-) Transcript_1463:2997-3644(-)